MTGEPTAVVAQAVVQRDHGRCCLCGRPCGPRDLWRCTEDSAFSGGARNFSLVCHGCRASIIGNVPAPARYVAHVHDTTRFRRALWRVTAIWLATLAVGSFAVLTGFVGVLLYRGLTGPFAALGAALLILFLLNIAGQAIKGWRGTRRRWVPVAQGVLIEERAR